MHILVTGGAGFVGTNLIQTLLEQWHRITCLDNLCTGQQINVDRYSDNPNYQFISHDVCEPFFGAYDQIYHLACPASPPHYQKDPIQTRKTSVLGTMHMLDLAVRNQCPILFSSTSEVYGDPHVHPQPEWYRGNVNTVWPRSCYDEGKRAAETICMDYSKHYNLPVRVIRIFNTYGPFMDPYDGRVITNFIWQALHDQPLTIYGDGSQTRSFQYIDDLVRGMMLMMNNTTNFLWPVNIGTQYEFTMKELALLVKKYIPSSTSDIVYQALPQDDPKQRKADNSLAQQELWWSPVIDLEEGLQKTIDSLKRIM